MRTMLRRGGWMVLFGLQISSASSADLGPPYNQPWDNLREDEKIIVVPGPQSPAPQVKSEPELKIDAIDGYKSVKFGTLLVELASRLRPHRIGNFSDPLDANGTYVLRVLYNGEESYGDFPVKVRVAFQAGRVHKIEVTFLAKGTEAFVKAFQEKYGPENDGYLNWRGKEVYYRIQEGARSDRMIVMRSLKLEEELRAKELAERKRREAEAERKAKEMKKDF